MSFRTYRLERPPSAYNAEQLAEKLAARAKWSTIFGLSSFLLLVLAGLGTVAFGLHPPLVSEMPDFVADFGGFIIAGAGVGAVLAGFLAIGIGMVGIKRENTNNRTLAFVGIFLGILAIASIVYVGLLSEIVRVLAVLLLVPALPILLFIVFAVYMFALP